MEIVALMLGIIMLVIFFSKLFLQRKKGIRTVAMGRSERISAVEISFSLSISLAIVIFTISFFVGASPLPFWAKAVGVVLCFISDILLAMAVICMRDSWRAGIPRDEKTNLITGGIYKFSRNPAFLSFDLMLTGLALVFFSIPALVTVIAVIISLHLQILREEKHLSEKFGEAYASYKKTTSRYFTF